MAVGPTENLSALPFSVSPEQIRISNTTGQVMTNNMRGANTATINSSSSIGSAGTGRGVSDAGPGIGNQIDLKA